MRCRIARQQLKFWLIVQEYININPDSALKQDIDSRVAPYKQINPTLTAPPYFKEILFETDRILLTRFRCGSHSLFIEKGRFSNVRLFNRVCLCGTGVQNILHCFTVCPLTLPLLVRRYKDLKEIFDDKNICDLLHKVCKTLKIPI